MATRKTNPAVEPNKLVRKQAGTYRTADDRFEAQQSGGVWFLVDSAQTNELGQPLVQGPFATLNALRDALPDARRRTVKSVSVPKPAKARASDKARRNAPAPPPPSWIDRLPKADATAVRRLIGALEREGARDAERLVRRDRDGRRAEVASWLIGQRLAALVDDLPASQRERTAELVRRILDVLAEDGRSIAWPLPGWSLIEIGPDPEPPNRRITVEDWRRTVAGELPGGPPSATRRRRGATHS